MQIPTSEQKLKANAYMILSNIIVLTETHYYKEAIYTNDLITVLLQILTKEDIILELREASIYCLSNICVDKELRNNTITLGIVNSIIQFITINDSKNNLQKI